MDRQILGERALGWKDGYKYGLEVMQAENLTREEELIQRGIRIGRNQTLREVDNVQWTRLFGIDVTASTIGSLIGSGLILALAIWLTNLPH